MNLLDFGFPGVLDNARKKSVVYFDRQSTATSNLIFFKTSTLGSSRNKLLPTTGQEMILIKGIKARFGSAYYTGEYLLKSFLSITINDVEKLKIPLMECISFPFQSTLGSFPNQLGVYGGINRIKKLEFPLIVNSSSNIDVKVSLGGGMGGGGSVTVELYCDVYDKLSDFEYDFKQNNPNEILSYSIYDTAATLTAAGSYQYFQDKSKPLGDYSKMFPLGKDEVFTIKAIESVFCLFQPTNQASNNISSLNANLLEIYVNDVLMFTSTSTDLLTLSQQRSGNVQDNTAAVNTSFVENHISNNNLILETPLIVPANSNVKVILTQPNSLAHTSGFNAIILKGDLIRRVQ